jgi:ribosomal protein S18 acetylase RimI-like enzyme
MPAKLRIEEYNPAYQPWFEKLNREWIERYFRMEPIDVKVLQHPDEYIIEKGGAILMAKYKNRIAATVALKFVAPGIYEFTKMAVASEFRGNGFGKALSLAAIQKARALGATKIILYSSTLLGPAINLYRKIGFEEVPVDGPYERSDIKMEMIIQDADLYQVRQAGSIDAQLIHQLGNMTFRDAFGIHNTPENMNAYLEKNFALTTIKDELDDPANVFLIADHYDRAVGYAKLRMGKIPPQLANETAIEIERIYAVKEYVGRKVGKKLMEACLRYGREHGFSQVWLGVWEHNMRAITFYEQWGFRKFGAHEFILGRDKQTDWLMAKVLKEHSKDIGNTQTE